MLPAEGDGQLESPAGRTGTEAPVGSQLGPGKDTCTRGGAPAPGGVSSSDACRGDSVRGVRRGARTRIWKAWPPRICGLTRSKRCLGGGICHPEMVTVPGRCLEEQARFM